VAQLEDATTAPIQATDLLDGNWILLQPELYYRFDRQLEC
jgi:hypothetical protein